MKQEVKKIKRSHAIMIAILVAIPLSGTSQTRVISGGNIGVGITTGIMPKTDKVKLPDPDSFNQYNMTNDKWPAVCFTLDLGLVFWEHHRLSYELCNGGYDAKIGENPTNYIYVDKLTREKTSDVYESIKRQYRNISNIFSYQYVVHTKIYGSQILNSLRFGPAVGTYQISAKTNYPDKKPLIILNDTKAKQTVYGFGTGITFYPDNFWYVDIGYRYLSCKGLAIDDFKTKGHIHQISITLGIGTLSW